MTPERQLAAIMFTDIVGYSALMGSDEQKAMQVLRVNRKIHKSIISTYHGKWLKEMGDGTLASFKTVSDAVYCAGELIKKCHDEGIGLRIGIHEGEIIVENDDIFGDGVNVASRLESIAEAGQILVSGPVNRNVKNKEGIVSVFLKEVMLKNIDDPIRVYQLEIDGTPQVNNPVKSTSSLIRKKPLLIALGIVTIALVVFGILFLKRPDKKQEFSKLEKSIAVLPFKNFSNDEKQTAFCDGQWEAVSSNLSRISGLRVISTQSTEIYRNSDKTPKQIADELGINFLIRGTIQKHENMINISVQLLNAKSGEQLWFQEFTKESKNIFQLQSDVATQIAEEMKIKLTESENEYLSNNIEILPEVYDQYLSGLKYYNDYFYNYDTGSFNNAKHRFKQVIEDAPKLSDAYIKMGWLYRYTNKDSCFMYLTKAIEIDKLNSTAHYYLASYYNLIVRDEDKWLFELKNGYALDPNHVGINYGLWNYYSGKRNFKEAIPHLMKIIKVNPNITSLRLEDRINYYFSLEELFLCIGDFDACNYILTKLKEIDPDYSPSNMGLLLTWQGKHEEALPYYLQQYNIDSNYFVSIDWLAECYSYLHKFDSADYYFRKCLKIKEKFPYEFPPIYKSYGYVLSKLGKYDEAEKMFEIHRKLAVSEDFYAGNMYDLAGNYAFHGKHDKAIEILNQLDFWYIPYLYIMIDPLFDSIRDNPEFIKILHKFEDEQHEIKQILDEERISDELKRFYSR